MTLYRFSVSWFNFSNDTEITSIGIVPASTYSEAITYIEDRFTNIDKITISNICDKFLFFESEEELNNIVEDF